MKRSPFRSGVPTRPGNRGISVYLLVVVLVGCGEATNSVEHYAEHKDERSVKLQECRSNPGELRHTPNCVNAMRSEAQEDFSSTNKGIPKGW
ncbi:EexN family lipoprotein [Bordetella sp. 02P26C-1]|uniref:EexN family lipoprotein n=1 Tax=Bordetella sp. 02P26C-1 TaxID=2683195 RepID=UPI001355E009|nr:EexN family lipoprotein [Bordetella sp. 02P26C-1]